MRSPGSKNDDDQQIRIALTSDEALVLFELLSRFAEAGNLEITHRAEWRVLWNVQCGLERQLTAPFLPDYKELLATARHAVADTDG